MRKQILVVDDDPLYLELVKDVLEIKEIDVVSAPNASAAITILKTFKPSFIISDFDMPGMSGMEFHARVVQDEPSRMIPFVFMTGSADETLSKYAKQHGLRIFNKNNVVNELFRLVDELK